jgi:hypothetical protein
VLALPNIFNLLPHKFARLSRGRLPLGSIPFGPFDRFFLWHFTLSASTAVEAVVLFFLFYKMPILSWHYFERYFTAFGLKQLQQ